MDISPNSIQFICLKALVRQSKMSLKFRFHLLGLDLWYHKTQRKVSNIAILELVINSVNLRLKDRSIIYKNKIFHKKIFPLILQGRYFKRRKEIKVVFEVSPKIN